MKAWQADLAIIGAAVIWGMAFIFTRWGLADCSPALFLTLRFALALAFSLALFGRRLAGISAQTLRQGLILGLLMGGGYLLQTYSVNFTEVSRAAFIAALTLPAIPIMGLILFRERIKLNNLAGIVLAVIGLYLLLDPQFNGLNAGDLLAFLSVPLWALYLIYINRFTEGKTEEHLTSRLLVTQFVGGLAAAGAVALVFESGAVLGPLHPDLGKGLALTGLFWAALLYCALLASVAIVLIQTACQKYTTAVQAMLCFQLEPVTATVGAWLLLGEDVGLRAAVGAAVIIAGVLASELGGLLMERRKAG
jgi:drug/metabolite transporter (DMT)-like permease